jgi:RimJ/RimL family protein N-acetyltransferase
VALAPAHRTARLSLRPVVGADEEAVVAAIDDIAVSGWLAVVPYPYTMADFQSFLTRYAVVGETFVIEDTKGFAGIMGMEGGVLGYWLAPGAQGRGYATEAGRCLLAAHFAGGGETVGSGYFDGNARSARVLTKLGFVEIGRDRKFCTALNIDRPHVVMQLTRQGFF